MAIVSIETKKEWDALAITRPVASGHFLHSWQWGEFQHSLGRRIFRFSDGETIAQIIELPLPFGKKYWYCPKGPLGRVQGTRYKVQDFLAALHDEAKKVGTVFIRIEPTVKPTSYVLRPTKAVQPRCTSIIDLTKSEQDLLTAMHQKTRYNIRVAEKHGVVVKWESGMRNEESWSGVWNLMTMTAKRDAFHLHPKAYYEKLITCFDTARGEAHLEIFTARYNSKPLAIAFVLFDPSTTLGTGGRTATYLHGASSSDDRNVMAPYALHWAIMRKAKEQGCARYDLWGISTGDEPAWEGITRFKTGFGGETICAGGTFDLPVNRFWYSVYRLARRLRP